MSLLSLIVAIILIGLVFWVIRALISAFSIGEPVGTIIYVLAVVLVVLWLLQAIGQGGGDIRHIRI